MVLEMPPTCVSSSNTSGFTSLRSSSSQAVVRPAGPAPAMTAIFMKLPGVGRGGVARIMSDRPPAKRDLKHAPTGYCRAFLPESSARYGLPDLSKHVVARAHVAGPEGVHECLVGPGSVRYHANHGVAQQRIVLHEISDVQDMRGVVDLDPGRVRRARWLRRVRPVRRDELLDLPAAKTHREHQAQQRAGHDVGARMGIACPGVRRT